jgi:Asparagine synthase (glutamine-hydrolyzing)
MCFDLFHTPYRAMCGIVGVFHRDGRMPDRVVVERMRDVMTTRGPDDAGLYIAEGVALGHRRLSIIDLSPAGHQPMPNEDESVWVVFNGEIYNFAGLRIELEQIGHRFRSRSDTEVILHGYEEWGVEGLLRRLHGMFAFGLWDARQRHLVLARDRLGKKPLSSPIPRRACISRATSSACGWRSATRSGSTKRQ